MIAPLSGEIIEVNEALTSGPENINDDPYGEGWMVRSGSATREVDDLMDADAYEASLNC